MTMNRQTHRKTPEVGIRTVIFQYFKAKPEMWRDAFNVDDTDRASIQDVEYTDFGPMQEGSELGGYTYDDGTEGPTTTYTPAKYVKAFKYSEEVLDDDQNGLMKKYPRAMARSIMHTLETTHWTHFNNAFDAAFIGADGKSFGATDHPMYGPGGGTQSNILSQPANFSATALEQMLTDIQLMTDDRGKFIALKAQKLYHPVQIWGEVNRVLGTTQEVGTANNTINVVKGAFPGGSMGVPYLTSTKAWFVKCDTHLLNHFWRKRISNGEAQDWDTDAYKHKAKGRWTSGWTKYLGWQMTPGV